MEDDKMILDVTCGAREIWFQKHEPHTLYCDRRTVKYESDYGTDVSHRVINVSPDMECDFTSLPFDDETFHLVVFDPPHLIGGDDSWIKKKYCFYDTKKTAVQTVASGIIECMRVLKVGGVLIFKWSEIHVSSREIIDACGIEPLFGHRSGRKMNTHWMTFMKFDSEKDGLQKLIDKE